MYEYKILDCGVKEAEKKMNDMAQDGWRVVAVSPNVAWGMGVIVTFEREKQ